METAEQELRDQREALLQAVNTQDWKTVESFLHASYTAKGILGLEFPRGFMIGLAKAALMVGRDFREMVQIDDVEIEGDRAELTITMTDSLKVLGLFPKEDVRRAKEIWKKIEGRWMMLSEEPAEAQ